jgi:hypothetical protein
MPETELLMIKAESLPSSIYEETVNSAYFAEKPAEVELEANSPNAVWLNKYHFWNENEYIFSISITSTMPNFLYIPPRWLDPIYR